MSKLVGVEEYCTSTLTDAFGGRLARSFEIFEDWPNARLAVKIKAHRGKFLFPHAALQSFLLFIAVPFPRTLNMQE